MRFLILVFCFYTFSLYSSEKMTLKSVKVTLVSVSSNIDDPAFFSESGINLFLSLCAGFFNCKKSRVSYLSKDGLENIASLEAEIPIDFKLLEKLIIKIVSCEFGSSLFSIC